tara:strand:+ start:220 stop:1863 length:1644 start_codon:yes stop_codon:yes gene_type:complete
MSKKYITPLEMLYKWEKEIPNSIFLRQPVDDFWHEWTWHDSVNEVRKMSAYLLSLNLPKNSKIGILSKNCAHWILSDLAIMMSGYISVPLYPNLSSNAFKQIIEHSEIQFIFIGKLDSFEEIRSVIPKSVKCISFPFYSQPGYKTWNDVVDESKKTVNNIVRDPKELATIIYTSGTTGIPKGVMHDFHNFSFSTTNAVETIGLNKDSFISYLPLCHIAERLLVEMGSLYSGGTVSFVESIDKFSENLKYIRPTVFLGVPRIWTKFQQGILSKIPRKRLNILLNIPFISKIIKNKIKSKLGLNKAKHIFTGAAPTPTSILKWFSKLDINIQEAYAMTENCCYSHVTLKDEIKVGFVGKALPLCKVKLSEKNEILIKHDGLMLGYYKEKEITSETIKDGWLYTGDEGFIDKQGFLKITGRVKDLFKTSKGKYVAPSPIEMKLSANKNIEQVCVVGNNIPQPLALIVLSEYGKVKSKIDLVKSLNKSLSIVNKKIEKHEKLNGIIVLDEPWTIDNGRLTPTMKVKRNEVEKLYQSNYELWYDDKSKIIFI